MLFGKSLLNSLFKYKRKVLRALSTDSPPPKILFFGTDNFSLPSLQSLNANCRDSLGVVTSFKSPANCVRIHAERENLPLQRWPITTDLCKSYDLGVVVSFGHMIPANIISSFPLGMINVHASLLPRWRGAAPIIYAIMNGDTRTGVSIMKIEPHHFDVGAILAQREVLIKRDVFMPELHASLAQLGANLLVETVNNIHDKLNNARVQDNVAATYAPKITRNIYEISWSEFAAEQLFARHRALYGFKHLTTSFLDKQVQLLELRLPEKSLELDSNEPGHLSYQRARKSLVINCARGTQLEILQLRLETKKQMSAQDFNNGFLKPAKSTPRSQLHFTQNKHVSC